ncbi:unnamed protein product [Malus baccata var. baccata]
MKFFGYKQSNSDHTLFLKHKKGKITALIVYVDDMVVTGNDPEEKAALQKYLASEFEMKDLGALKYFLGIEVAHSQQGIFLSQRKYVLDIFMETRMLACKPADTPIELNHKLGEYPDQIPTNKERYQRIVAPRKRLMFSKHDHLDVKGYTDADWVGDVTNRRSTSRYFVIVGGKLVSWRNKKQKVVARSSAEAEYWSMAHGVCELLWVKNLLRDLGFRPKHAIPLHCDNKAAIDIAHNPVQHDRTKHMEVDRHFIKEKIEAILIEVPFVKSEDQLVNMLTKTVTSSVFHNSLSKLGIHDIYVPT